MAESQLTQTYYQLMAEVGNFLGYGRGTRYGSVAWTTDQQTNLDFILQSGLRRFYFCGFDWSFLQPIGTIILPPGVQSVQCPDDFGGTNSQATLKATTTQTTWMLPIGNELQIRGSYQVTPQASGRPLLLASVPVKGTGPTQSTRYDLLVYPQTDNEYVVQLPYTINPDYLTGAFPYAYGGAPHAETLRAACLAAAEETLDDSATTWNARFTMQLQESIKVDRRAKPQFVGYNRDNSDNSQCINRATWHGWGQVTVQGVYPGGPPY